MKLVDDWQWIFAKAWTVKLTLISALLQGIVFVLPMVTPPHPPLWFVILALVLQIAAILFAIAAAPARVVSQPKLREGPPDAA